MKKSKSTIFLGLLVLLAAQVFAQKDPFAPSVQTTQGASLPMGMDFVSIPSGSFQMGSPSSEPNRDSDEPIHSVYVNSFELMSTEVTQGMWEEVMGETPSLNFGVGYNYPVNYISWNDCQEFVEKLNDLDPSHSYRLPAEVEWEYACRAGSRSSYYWGNTFSVPELTQKRAGGGVHLGGNTTSESGVSNRYCWYVGNSSSTAHPVGTKIPNAWGLYDMSGNVWEWCEDIYTRDYSGCPLNGNTCSDQDSYRVLRGGGWTDPGSCCRSAERIDASPGYCYAFVGFRLARSNK